MADCPCDLNGDGVVDDADKVIFDAAYGSKIGDANWNPACDFDGNGVVDLDDFVEFAGNYGPCPVTAPDCPWDLNGDGVVDAADSDIFAKAFGSRPGDANWNPACDFDNDGYVSMADGSVLGMNYGPCPGTVADHVVTFEVPNGATLKVGGVEVV